MKKRDFSNNLKLRKQVISNLQEQHIQGGTDSVGTTTYVIITTVKILTEYVTDPRICRTTDATECTMTGVTTSTPVPATTTE
ncbi:class I lanthipeptide [Kordia jejudonensis]|uniref:class I lanthipeptide n=1 Tax=Kordia jejudonensis TaxID=1348245 RepID=UPI0006296D52|nr:class I lanthipeptide [Kordia jejudonensis]